jgi:hypothetical protein
MAAALRGGFMAKEIPYSKINPRELKDLEAEFGHTLTPELAQCLIRYRINRGAIDLMLRKESSGRAQGSSPAGQPAEIHRAPAPKSEDSKKEEAESEEALGSRLPGARRTARKAVA